MWPFSKPTKSEIFRKDIKTLVGHIDTLRSKGLDDEQIAKKLSSAGWRQHVVELVLHDAHRPESRVGKLQEYVKNQKLKGRSPEEIKETLIDAGWSEDIIDTALGLE